MSAEHLVDYEAAVEWDVVTWRRALMYWQQVIARDGIAVGQGLELGARHGGLTYFFCRRYGARMQCTDLGMPSDRARRLHAAAGLSHLVSYAAADATAIPFADGSFDFVVFKSVLGVVGANGQPARIQAAVGEVRRVLRPGGVLLFAENLVGSPLHRFCRRLFVPWGKSWHYLTLPELQRLLAEYAECSVQATGFWSAFGGGSGRLRDWLARVDALCPCMPRRWRYVAFGIARK